MTKLAKFSLTRELQIPKGSLKVADKLSDAVAYLYTSKSGSPGAIVFVGKQAKPFWHFTFKSPERREARIVEAFKARREQLGRKQVRQAERKSFVHGYKVGDILHTCWGYEQTNREFFEVTEVRGKWLILREIAQMSEDTGWLQGRCAPQPGHYIGEPIRRLAQDGQVKINDFRYAWKSEPTMIAGARSGSRLRLLVGISLMIAADLEAFRLRNIPTATWTREREMNRYYLTHTDQFGELHQLGGAYEAETPEAAIAQMLADTSTEDDGNWLAHVVESERDIL